MEAITWVAPGFGSNGLTAEEGEQFPAIRPAVQPGLDTLQFFDNLITQPQAQGSLAPLARYIELDAALPGIGQDIVQTIVQSCRGKRRPLPAIEPDQLAMTAAIEP